jgi:ATP-dependent Clp protease protease subunit
MSSDGVEALRKITNKAAVDPSGAYVPTIRDRDGSGYDLFSLLMKERIVTLYGQVDDSMAAVAVASLLYLGSSDSPDSSDKNDPRAIKVYINSPGGSVLAGFAIIDAMESLESKVITIGLGLQASMGSHLLAAGDVRKMTEKSFLMIHGASSRTEGKVTDQRNDLAATDVMVELGTANYIRHIGLTDEFWGLCDKEAWFTAQQAKEIGFIKDILPARKEDNKHVLAEDSAQKFLFNKAAARQALVPATEHEIILALAGTGPNAKLGNEIRPELLVALAKMPKYWVVEKQEQFAAEHNIDLSKVKAHPHVEGSTRHSEIAKVLDKYIETSKVANDNNAAPARKLAAPSV